MGKGKIFASVSVVVSGSDVMLVPSDSGGFVKERKDELVASTLFLSPSVGMFCPEIHLSIDPTMSKYIPEIVSEDTVILSSGIIRINYLVSFSFDDDALPMKDFVLLDGLPVFINIDSRTLSVPFAFVEFEQAKSLEDSFSTELIDVKTRVLSADELHSKKNVFY